MTKHPQNLVEAEKRIFGASGNGGPPPGPTRRLAGVPGRVQAILERKRQAILYGPPGTGKTHWAWEATRGLAAISNFGVAYDELSNDERSLIEGDDSHGGMVRTCTFHPSYGYEDFLEGYRPNVADGRMVFSLRDGIFKQLCKDAGNHLERNYYLVIDEINRGDIPRIFGELLTVLEKDKRDRSILLPLTGEPFSVPDNVYLIGTMNTADRSIALLDTALRRRFGFVELMPDSSVLGNVEVGGIPLAPWLDALNQSILSNIGQDARNLQIGHSFLLEGGHPVSDFSRFSRILLEDIVPLLEEYSYEDYSILERILGKDLIDTQKQQVRYELFDASRQADLVQALMSPEISTSAQAASTEQEAHEVVEEESPTE